MGGLRGPVVLILLGLLFLVDKWSYSFGQLWPSILIVFGLMKIAEALAPIEGHVGA